MSSPRHVGAPELRYMHIAVKWQSETVLREGHQKEGLFEVYNLCLKERER